MKKETRVFLLVCAILLTGCTSDDGGSVKQQGAKEPESIPVTTGTQQGANAEGPEMKPWSSENNEVKISVVKEDKYGTPEVVSVDVNGVEKEFNWLIVEDPRVFYTDVTSDSKPEAVIINNVGKGSGASIEELHVLNGTDLSEIKVPSYEEVVTDIESKVMKDESGKLTIKVKAQGKEYEFSGAVDPGMDVQDKLLFGGSVNYRLENQEISSYFGASVGTTSPKYISRIYATYKFDSLKNEFIIDQISAEKYQ